MCSAVACDAGVHVLQHIPMSTRSHRSLATNLDLTVAPLAGRGDRQPAVQAPMPGSNDTKALYKGKERERRRKGMAVGGAENTMSTYMS